MSSLVVRRERGESCLLCARVKLRESYLLRQFCEMFKVLDMADSLNVSPQLDARILPSETLVRVQAIRVFQSGRDAILTASFV